MFASLIYENQFKPVHHLAKQETVLPSKKVDPYPILAVSGNDQFSIPVDDIKEKIISKPLDSFSFEVVKIFQN